MGNPATAESLWRFAGKSPDCCQPPGSNPPRDAQSKRAAHRINVSGPLVVERGPDAGRSADPPVSLKRLFRVNAGPWGHRVPATAAPPPLHADLGTEQPGPRAIRNLQPVGEAKAGRNVCPRAIVCAGADGRVSSKRCMGLKEGALAFQHGFSPAKMGRGSRDPSADRSLIEGEPESAQGWNGHRLALRRIIHIVVVPESNVEIDPPALSSTNAFEEPLHQGERSRGQILPAADIPEHRVRLVVAPEVKKDRRVFQSNGEKVGPILREPAEKLRRLHVVEPREQSLRRQEPKRGRVDAMRRQGQQRPAQQPVCRLRLSGEYQPVCRIQRLVSVDLRRARMIPLAGSRLRRWSIVGPSVRTTHADRQCCRDDPCQIGQDPVPESPEIRNCQPVRWLVQNEFAVAQTSYSRCAPNTPITSSVRKLPTASSSPCTKLMLAETKSPRSN